MGAEEVPGVQPRAAWSAVLLVAALLALGGCGEDSEGTEPSPGELLGPTAPQGDIDPSPATLRAEDGYTTLVTSQVTTRGAPDALIVGQIELTGAGQPQFRLMVDGERERDAEVNTVSNGGKETAVVSCACKFPTGEHVVVLEGTSDGTARVGARSLIVFPEPKLDETNGLPLSASVFETDAVQVTAEGATLAQVRPSSDDGDGPLVIFAAMRAPRAGVGAENVRLEVLVGDEGAEELASTTIPSGKIVAYLDSDGADVGDPVTLRGYVTSGTATVAVSSIAVCPCGLDR